MTFYQELQLNQAGSKNLLKNSETVMNKYLKITIANLENDLKI